MIYIFGTVGFFAGFMLGQIVLAYLLRGRTQEELLNDRGLRWRYGTLAWLIAFASAGACVYVYDKLFLS